jgi:uncharacterized protein
MSSQIIVTTETLRKLHRIHGQLQDLHERLDRGPRLAKAHQSNLERLEAQCAEVQAKAKAMRVNTDAKQLQLLSNETAVQRRRGQLREAKDNREYQALVDQIAADEMTNSVLADEILEAMERVDEVNRKLATAQAALAKGKADADKTAAECRGQEPLIRGDIERLEKELHQDEKELPDSFRAIYHRLTKAKGGDALAPIIGEYCGGCNQHVPTNMCNDLVLNKPIFCLSCGRLLYVPENHEPQ